MNHRLLGLLGIVTTMVVAFLMFPTSFAAAHELMTDSTQTQTAILHVDPDDTIVAGKVATIYFEPRNYALLQVPHATVTLTVQKGSRVQTKVRMKIDGELASQRYTFASEGAYTLSFKVISGSATYTFSASQQVKPNPNDATEAGWIATIGFLVIIVIVGSIYIVIRVNRSRKSAAPSDGAR